jgi:diguanylate cyclase (GGDEF)-like protein
MNYRIESMDGRPTELSNPEYESGPIEILSLDEIKAEAATIVTSLQQPGADTKMFAKRLDILFSMASGLDPLCDKVANKRLFNQRLEEEVYRAQRTNEPLSAIILDLDNFREINNTHGHLEGDKYLRKVAQLLREGVKKSDTVARTGGDEFAILLPNTSLVRAIVVTSRILQQDLPASIGIAQLAPNERAEAFLERADKTGLYTAKRQGKGIIGLVLNKEQNFSISGLHSHILNDPSIEPDNKTNLIEYTLNNTILIPAA